jgi:hypothetical protein
MDFSFKFYTKTTKTLLSFEYKHHFIGASKTLLSFEHRYTTCQTGKTRRSRYKPLAEGVTIRDISLVSGRAGVALSARVLHAGLSDETWSA